MIELFFFRSKITSRLALWAALILIPFITSCAFFIQEGLVRPIIFSSQAAGIIQGQTEKQKEELSDQARQALRVMTLNIAHGKGRNSILIPSSRRAVKKNLEKIAAIFKREGPDIVGLQEADISSWWSGNFNHVEYLLACSSFRWAAQGQHSNCSFPKFYWGTALLFRFIKPKIDESWSVNFIPAFPFFSKGFILSSIEWPARPGLMVDIVSLHLDPIKKQVRRDQIATIIRILKARARPIIILGDFNCEWKAGSALYNLARELNLHTFRPHERITTFPRSRKRLDWILISSEHFKFRFYKTLKDSVSDHLPVLAEIILGANKPLPQK